jgi:hypothetical protein
MPTVDVDGDAVEFTLDANLVVEFWGPRTGGTRVALPDAPEALRKYSTHEARIEQASLMVRDMYRILKSRRP